MLSAPKTTFASLLRESFLNASVFLLLGSLLSGWVTGLAQGKSLETFMSGLFNGMVIFFLLDTGMQTGSLLGLFKKTGAPLVVFGLAVPESNPGLVELLSLGITLRFNITLGIPWYWLAIRWMWGMN